MVHIQKLPKKYLIASLVIFGLTFVFSSPTKAHAATLQVDSSCTLQEAATVINNAVDGSGCVKTGAAYGTSDTINIPAGTVTLTGDIEPITKTISIIGAGKTSTIIDANDFVGFGADFSADKLTQSVTLKDFTINHAESFGININDALTAIIQNVIVDDSEGGVNIIGSQAVTVEDSSITNNVSTLNSGDAYSGLKIQNIGLNTSSTTTATVKNTIISNNVSSVSDSGKTGISVDTVGSILDDNDQKVAGHNVIVQNVTVSNNSATQYSGVQIVSTGGPTSTVATSLKVDATTVANNTVTVKTPQTVVPGQVHEQLATGIFLTGKLANEQNFTNVTVANNTINNPAPDNRTSVAGFFGSMAIDSASMKIINVTVVNNNVVQPNMLTSFAAFIVVRLDLDFSGPSVVVDNITNGSSSQNGLIAHNLFNGQSRNCLNNFDLNVFGYDAVSDVTPEDLGSNLSDDQSCTGYRYSAGLYDTIDHEVKSNGGTVPTIALLANSPAINAGSQVLGISTDARGVARNGYYSVGAYQGELLAGATTKATLANTGIRMIPPIILGLIVFGIIIYTYSDFRKHRKPLVQADPYARHTYTYGHHISSVTIPLLRYRLHISLNSKPSGFKKF